MSPFFRMHPRSWLIVSLCALALLIAMDRSRTRRVEYVTGLARADSPADAAAPTSPAGSAPVRRELIVPERNENSFAWIAQTQQMLAQGEARVRHIDYENAPFGREVNSTSPYRWWLGLVAWLEHLVSGRPVGQSVERAALLADPLLHGLMLLGGAAFVAWRFGAFAAALFSIAVVTVFPLAAAFLPGAPDARGLADLFAFGSVLVVLAAARLPSAGEEARAVRLWFVFAGVVGGLGLWISVATEVLVLAGILLGALAAAWVGRGGAPVNPPGGLVMASWRAWSLAGGLTVLASYLLEFAPDYLGTWRLESIHPLYGLAWIGGGELLARAVGWAGGRKPVENLRDAGVVLLAVVALAAVPVAMSKTGDPGFLLRDLLWARLTSLPNGIVAGSLRAWLVRDGFAAAVCTTFMPLVVVFPVGWILARRKAPLARRMSLALALGPVPVALWIASSQLSWWSVLDALLLVVLVAATAQDGLEDSGAKPWLWVIVVAVFAVPGVTQLWPREAVGPGMTLTARETEELVERHLAHWLAQQAGQDAAVVYAPPHQTTAFCYYGGLRGIGTFATGNRAGFGTTLAIAGVTTMEEVAGLLRSREVKYVVVPSWDPFFDEFARLYLAKSFSNRTSFFVRELRQWNLPSWLRAIPYQMPVSGGVSGQLVSVFEVVDEQSPVVASSRLAEYLVEMGDVDRAAAASEALRRFPGDIGALAARAQVQIAQADSAGTTQTLEAITARLAVGADRYLPWDRRVSLAIVLARGQQIDMAREQVKRCLNDLDEPRLRSLTTGSLYGLQVLAKVFDLEITDPRLRVLAVDLLPPDLRSRL